MCRSDDELALEVVESFASRVVETGIVGIWRLYVGDEACART